MFLSFLVLCSALPSVTFGARVAPAGAVREIQAHRGVPKLEVLRTSSAAEAAAFLEPWASAREFGLFVQLSSDGVGIFRERAVALVGVARGGRVLLFDLRPLLRQQQQPSQPLPAALADFLRDEKRTFFGMGLLRPAALLAKAFGISVRSIDMKVRGWRQVGMYVGLYHAADRLLGVSFKRRPSLRQLTGQAVHTYLQWAVAEYCRSSYGKPKQEWVLDAADFAAVNVTRVRAAAAKDDEQMNDEMLREVEVRAEQLMRRRATARQLGSRGTWGQEKKDRFASAREFKGRMQQVARLTRQAARAGQ